MDKLLDESGGYRWVRREVPTGEIYYDRNQGVIHNVKPSFDFFDENKLLNLPTYDLMAPLRVYFDPTYSCNLQYRHCITRSSPYVDTSREMSFDRMKSLFMEFHRTGVLEVIITGGEPFYHPRIFEILDSLNKFGLNQS